MRPRKKPPRTQSQKKLPQASKRITVHAVQKNSPRMQLRKEPPHMRPHKRSTHT